MELLYQNFDKLEVTFQGALPEALLLQLEEARTRAQTTKKEAFLELGTTKMPVLVAESGAMGGYRYRFDTGPDGETWMIAYSTKLDGYNIRVSVHSMCLALHGYQAVKASLLHKLNLLNAMGPKGGPVIERISRLDYCFDFLFTESFNPDPTHFIAHQKCKKASYMEKPTITAFTNTQGDEYQTITIGKMPGRQASLYNKSIEIKASNKAYWRDIWQLEQKPAGTVWRVEVRAGKDELDKWNVKRFGEFEEKVGDVILSILKAMRYTAPTSDSNRWRWPMAPFWQGAVEAATQALAPYICQASREKILRDYRLNVKNRYKVHILGSVIGYTAVSERDPAEIGEVITELGQDLMSMVMDDQDRYLEKFDNANHKFRFLT